MLILAVLAIGISFQSCKKDKEERESLFTLNNIDHKTDHGYIKMVEQDATRSAYYVLICSPELTFSNSGVDGYGDFIMFVIISNSPDELLPGEYTLAAASLNNATTFLSYDSDLADGVIYTLDNTEAQTVEITTHGDVFTFEYTLNLSTNKELTGYFKGSLEEIVAVPKKLCPPFSFN